MTHPKSEPPTEWSPLSLIDVGGGVYVHVPVETTVGDKGTNVLVYHWHEPSLGHPRWQLTACGLHDVESADPLTLSPSLACDEGCPNHGWIKNGSWSNA